MTHDDQTLKRTYKIWWEYLKLSDKYKDYCEIMDRAEGKSGREYDAIIGSLSELMWTKKKDPWDMYTTCVFFGNVHQQQFDTWWEKRKGFFVNPVFEFSDPDALVFIELQLSDAYRFLRKYDKDYMPTLGDIVKMFTTDKDYFYVGIPKEGLNASEISKELTRIRNKMQKKQTSTMKFNPFSIPMQKGKLYLENLEIYLEVYQKKKEGFTITDIIIKKEGENIREKKEVLQRLQSDYSDYVEKAKRIIKNVENGIFPGSY
jgi:hypothetical protein